MEDKKAKATFYNNRVAFITQDRTDQSDSESTSALSLNPAPLVPQQEFIKVIPSSNDEE